MNNSSPFWRHVYPIFQYLKSCLSNVYNMIEKMFTSCKKTYDILRPFWRHFHTKSKLFEMIQILRDTPLCIKIAHHDSNVFKRQISKCLEWLQLDQNDSECLKNQNGLNWIKIFFSFTRTNNCWNQTKWFRLDHNVQIGSNFTLNA